MHGQQNIKIYYVHFRFSDIPYTEITLLSILIIIGSNFNDFEIMIRMWCVKKEMPNFPRKGMVHECLLSQ